MRKKPGEEEWSLRAIKRGARWGGEGREGRETEEGEKRWQERPEVEKLVWKMLYISPREKDRRQKLQHQSVAFVFTEEHWRPNTKSNGKTTCQIWTVDQSCSRKNQGRQITLCYLIITASLWLSFLFLFFQELTEHKCCYKWTNIGVLKPINWFEPMRGRRLRTKGGGRLNVDVGWADWGHIELRSGSCRESGRRLEEARAELQVGWFV